MYKRPVSVFSAFLLLFLLSSCSSSPVAKTASLSDLATQKKTDKLNEAIMLSAASQQPAVEEGYLVGPEDLLEIEAYNVDEVKKLVRVNSQGEIALPLAGILNVKGLTTSEIEQLIAKKLEKYVQETVVTVYVKEYKSQRISVIGAVNKPQIFSVTGQRYLVDMLMMAEGVSKDAGSICYVLRPVVKNNPNSRAETIVIDLDQLLIDGNLELNIPVFAGDVINIPKGGLFFVDGAVKTPGVYNLRGRTTLVQAVSMAQGANSDAKLDDVRIFRDNGKGEREVLIADYGSMKNGEKPDFLLAENDIIIVPKSGIKNFFNGFVSTIKGLISFGTIPIF